jgi:hypothetical protein
MVTRPKPDPDPMIANEAPMVPQLTDYDFLMLERYLRLLDAESEGADWREVAQIVLKVDPDMHYVHAKRVYDSHIARAHWMTEHGYRQLLREAEQEF